MEYLLQSTYILVCPQNCKECKDGVSSPTCTSCAAGYFLASDSCKGKYILVLLIFTPTQ